MLLSIAVKVVAIVDLVALQSRQAQAAVLFLLRLTGVFFLPAPVCQDWMEGAHAKRNYLLSATFSTSPSANLLSSHQDHLHRGISF